MILKPQRDLFDLPPEVSYFNCAYLSPQLRAVTQAGHKAMATKASPWTVTVEDFFDTSERVRQRFASLVGTGADNIALLPSVSYGIGTAAANLPVKRGDRIVLLEEQFPSNVYPWRRLAADVGAQIVAAPRGHGGWTESVLDALVPGVAVAALPACHWTDGSSVGLEAISQRCRQIGAALVLDLTQSLGAAPFDVAQVDPDFMVAASYKWLLGPYGSALMYVAPRHHDGRPLEEGWIVREQSENFAGLVDYKDGYQPGARRYDVGQRSNFALMPMVAAALEQLLDWGVNNIAQTLAATTSQIEARVMELGFEVAGPRLGHMMGLRAPGGLPQDLSKTLQEQGVYVSVRGDAIRVSPHLYTTPSDVDRLGSALQSAMKR